MTAGQMGISRHRVLPFVEHIEGPYSVVDLVVSAADTVTLAELACLDKPTIVIPTQELTENHQSMNVLYYTTKGACVLIPPWDDGSDLAERTISTFIDKN
jgi:UDP-N-acetylglucosamine--N-acetylmuramyl-(pentapeptide) pyrophosphoryl-undecaprenol N-acetylglucosamine transferase